MELKAALLVLISYEDETDTKLSLLTEIGLTAKNELIFETTETIRAELVEAEEILK